MFWKLSKCVLVTTLLMLAGCNVVRPLYGPANLYESVKTKNNTKPSENIITITLWSPSLSATPEQKLTIDMVCISGETHESSNEKSSVDACKYKILIESWTQLREQDNRISQFFQTCSDSEVLGGSCMSARNRLVSYLTSTANDNCRVFKQDLSIFKTAADGSYALGRDLMSGGSVAAVAAGAPPLAGGLSLGNLLMRSYETFNQAVFLGETSGVIIKAIEAAQKEAEKKLSSSCGVTATYGNCDVYKAMDHIRTYSESCSLRAGVLKLQEAISVSDADKTANTAAETATNSEATAKKAMVTATSAQEMVKNIQPTIQRVTDLSTKVESIDKTLNEIKQTATSLNSSSSVPNTNQNGLSPK